MEAAGIEPAFTIVSVVAARNRVRTWPPETRLAAPRSWTGVARERCARRRGGGAGRRHLFV